MKVWKEKPRERRRFGILLHERKSRRNGGTKKIKID
jgi:hypothetical protein